MENKPKTIKDVHLPAEVEITLKQMFEARRYLTDKYIERRMIQYDYRFPLLDDGPFQDFIRQEMGNLQEEVFEAIQELEIQLDSRTAKEIDLNKIHEEHADVLHFWLEILLYSGLDENWLHIYTTKLLNENNIEWVANTDTLFNLIQYVQIKESFSRPIRGIQLDIDDPNFNPYLIAIKTDRLNHNLVASLKYLNISRNHLKNKYWKTKHTPTNIESYHQNLMEGFLYYLKYLRVLGYTSNVLIETFLKKNIINIYRIES